MKKLLWVLILLLLPLSALAEDAESHRDGAFFYQIADGEATLTGCDWDAMQADSLYMFAEPQVSLEIPARWAAIPSRRLAAGCSARWTSAPWTRRSRLCSPKGFARWMPTPSPNASMR